MGVVGSSDCRCSKNSTSEDSDVLNVCLSHSNSNIVVVVGGSNIKVLVVGDIGSGCRCSVINVCRLDCRGSRWCLCSRGSRWCYCVV